MYNNQPQHIGNLCVPPDPCEPTWAYPVNQNPLPTENGDVFVGFAQAAAVTASVATKTTKIGTATYTYYYGNWSVQTADGGKHPLGLSNQGTTSWVQNQGDTLDYFQKSTGPFEAIDASGWRTVGAETAAKPNQSGGMIGSPTAIVSPDGNYYGPSIKDPNGNTITLSGTLTDSLGRTIPLPPTAKSASNTSSSVCPSGPLPILKAVSWTPPGYSGSTLTYVFCYVTITPNMPPTMMIGPYIVYGPIPPSTNLQSIVLPNGQYWQFEYNDTDSTLTYNGQPVTYGTLSKITLPNGGSIAYQNATVGGGAWSGCYNSGRFVTSRTVSDENGSHTWTYNYGTSVGTVVTDPLGNDTAHASGANTNCAGYEGQTQYYQGSYSSGTLLKSVSTTYSYSTGSGNVSGDTNVVPSKIVTSLSGSGGTMVSQVTYLYDPGFSYTNYLGATGLPGIYGKAISESDYDYGNGAAGSLLRTTNTSYAWQSPHLNYSTYLSNNLLDLPYSVQINDSGGTQRAYTYYGYDESPLQSSGVTKQKSTGESFPGNQTSVHRWLNGSTTATTNCNVSISNGNLVSNKVYFDTGEVQKNTDPCTYPTTYAYSSTYYGAFLTTATNALNQNTSYGYDFDMGVLTSMTDLNSQITSENYDILARPISITYPDTGSASFCYTDMGGQGCTQSGPPYELVATKAIASGLNKSSTLVFDELGRLSQTQLTSDPDGVDYVDTTYDADGRKYTVSNPHRSASSTTDGITTSIHDALGRACVFGQPDGATVSQSSGCPTTAPKGDLFTQYSGNCTTVTDEVGNARQSCVDGLGRMTSILEDPGSSPHLNYQTLYQYDALGNLTNVTQNGSNSANARTRSFIYDSISHLTSAQNPESGTITYAYDADGNIITRTAPSPNQPSTGTSTVTTSYAYDKLNRLTGKAYADTYSSNPATASASYGYDGVPLTGCNTPPPTLPDSYPVGRRTAMCDGSGATSWSHDKMGRELSDIRDVDGITKTTSYTYNLDGSLSTLTYPGTGQTITYTPGGAGRPTAAQDLYNSVNYVESATYAPFGGLTSMANGLTASFTGFTTTNAYNDRLQPILLSAATSSGSVFSLCYDFHLGVVVNTSPCSFAKSTLGDNGNVYQLVNNRPGYSGRTQAFTYDVLNRINSGQSSGTYWGENFTIDAWGNLTTETGISGKTYSESLNVSVGTNNRFTTSSGFTYDAAGNLSSQQSGPTYRYDGENRLVYTSAGGYNYYYDGDGNRVAKSNGTTGTAYWRGPTGDPIFESSLTGTNQEEYIFFNGSRVARMDVGSNAAHYYFSDHLGSSAVVETANGSSCEQDIDYYPYGGVMSDFCPNIAQHYRFTGKERDSESGLDNFGARYDASSMGRFMTPDPVPWAHWQDGSKKDRQRFAAYISNPQNFNMYAYVRNNPLNSIDPTGELVYVVLYTTGNSKGDEQLKKAAETKANDIANSKTFDPKKDTVLLLGVKTKSDFQNLLNAANSLDSKFGQVQSVSLFSHAGDQSGPIFHDQNGKPSQFSSSELSGINVNWSNSATASFYGCNTGVNFTRDFANAQQVPAYGFMGGVDFSGSPDTKSKGYVLNPYNRDLYMIDVQEKGLQRQDPDE